VLATSAELEMIALFKSVPVLAAVHQLQFNYGVIRLDKSLALADAHHLKDYRTSKSVDSLVNELLDEISHKFKNFYRGKYQQVFSYLLANLFYASSHGKGVLYDRAKNKRCLIQLTIIDFLSDKGLIDSIIQPPNDKGNCSYITAMPELTNLLNVHKIRIANGKKEFNPLVLRNEQKKELSTLRLRTYKKGIYKALVEGVELHNAYWESNAVTIKKKVVIPFLHRVFNINTDLGGRFYGLHQQFPSKERSTFLFNGKPTVELDYSSLHIAILYAWKGIEMIGDPYRIKDYDRDAVKGIFLRLVNVKNLSSLEGVITMSAKESTKERYSKYKKDREHFELRASKGLVARAPTKPKFIDSHIENVPTGFNSKQFIKDLKQRHSAIKSLLGDNDIGLRLQRADSELMNTILVDLYSRKLPVPCLPVHDSLICRKSNLELIRLTMQHHFKLMFGANIAVK
tara:strand:+ start:27 stop:1394 length:1368 start_codon:yes stop_codon:yes gene_type:complete